LCGARRLEVNLDSRRGADAEPADSSQDLELAFTPLG
jgi:hypothetical protein